MYQQRDLGVVAVAALGVGFLVGASMQETESAPPPINGMTIVRHLELPPRLNDGWGGAWPLVAPLKAELIPVAQTERWSPAPAQSADEDQQAQAIQRERQLLTQPPEPPHDVCYPGKREWFYYRRVQHWRCRY